MKKLLFLLLVSGFVMAQENSIQIKLVNSAIGNYVVSPGSICSCGYQSNDPGLNAIFANYTITSYDGAYPHPYYPGIEPEKLFLINCYNCDVNQFAADLTAYSSVIEKATSCPEPGVYSDLVSVKMIDSGIAASFSISGPYVVTNNAALNQIFQNRNVLYYYDSTGSWINGLTCDCNVGDLKNDLIANNFILPNTTHIFEGNTYSNYDNYQYMYNGVLNTNDLLKPKAVISPNPFSSNFNIKTEQTVINYSLIDFTGKTVANTSSKGELDSKAFQLSAGLYILNLQFDNGQTANYKVVKK